MRLEDRPTLLSLLKQAGAEHRGDFLETNTFFDTEEGRLKSSDQGLRIRVEHPAADAEATRITLTHKGPRMHGKLKSRSETEVNVQDAKDAADMLSALGFHPVLSFEKRRSRFKFDHCLVELDTLPYLGEYVEIEGPDDDTVLAARERLGLADAPLVKTSYISMLMAFVREHNLTTKAIRFDDAQTAATSAA